MAASRTVRRTHAAYRDDIRDLVTRRPLPGPQLPQLDPFLFLNHHGPQTYAPNNHGLPFGPHPHRGFETVTFILEGELSHLDSGGHESVIRAGGVQWMTAGSGLVHAELSPMDFKRRGGPLEILQLWVNLPSRLKMTAPAYAGLQREDIPAIDLGGATLNLVAGSFGSIDGPVEWLLRGFMSTVEFDEPGVTATLPAPKGRSVFFYVVRGRLRIGGELVRPHHLVELNDDGDQVDIEALDDATILFGHAEPIGEPVVAHGPFVMNTREEIAEAVADYQAGKFGQVSAH
ncbi:MAG TPA: pirin family protein [Caulobacteraceae bacterium]|nr:pirin family protein [Caulobacteraceae bacterium]